jgi:hypothetical protein
MAVAASQVSQQSDQLELLGDVDLAELQLIVQGREVFDIRPRLTAAPVSRTINGASTITLSVRDRDRRLAKSGFLRSKPVDIEVDGYTFRYRGLNRQGDDLELTFEDLVVSVLRDYPKADAPHKGFKVWDAHQVSRLDVVQFLVGEPGRSGGIKIPLVTLGGHKAPVAAPAERQHARGHGFAPGAAVTVKGQPATPAQKDVLDELLQVGESLGARRKVLVTGVMVATQESAAGDDVGHDPNAVGVFQQNPKEGWPATGNVVPDSTAFFKAAIAVDRNFPNVTPEALAQAVQHSGAGASRYQQWRTEAEHTVTDWGVAGTEPSSTTQLISTDGSFQFMRGSKTTQNGQTVYTREDNWTMLQRLASEVNWRCFPVSGAIYFVTDTDLLASQPRMTITEKTPGVDQIDGSFDEGRRSVRKGHRVQQLNEQVKVTCRTRRWQAPPGTSVEIDDTGIFDGRWIVAQIDRDILTPDGTVTLNRPQAALAEAKAPEYLTAGTAVFTGNGPVDIGGGNPALRSAIVAAALKAVERRADFRYRQVRPMPASLFDGAVPKYVDCSSFFTLVYKTAGAPDPNGLSYNGSGNTATLLSNGHWTTTPQAGDAVMYGPYDSPGKPHHVAVFVGEGFKIVNMGGEGDPREMSVSDVPLPLLGYVSFLTSSPADDHHHRG